MPDKKKPAEKKSRQLTLRLTPAMVAEIDESRSRFSMSFMDWVRGACQERLEREKMGLTTKVGRMTETDLKAFVQKVILETETGTRSLHLSEVSDYDRKCQEHTRALDMLDDFGMMETDEEREEWAGRHLFPFSNETDLELPEGVKIYGVMQGHIIYTADGMVGFCTFDQMFPETVEVPEEPGTEEKK